MIYDKSGQRMFEAYDKKGVYLRKAYDVDGNIIFTPEYDYEEYSIVNTGGFAVGQGIDIYGDILVSWDEATPRFRLWKVSDKSNIANIPVTSEAHGNDISFLNEFYADGDELPLVCVIREVYRIYKPNGSWTADYIKTIQPPTTYQLGNAFVDNLMITVGYTQQSYAHTATNRVIIETWDMDNLTLVDGVYVPEKISETTRNWLNCMQGATWHDGYLWIVCGLGGTNAIVYALDIDTGDIAYTIDSGQTGEPEGLAWAFNNIDGWFLMWWQKTAGGMQKCTFAMKTSD